MIFLERECSRYLLAFCLGERALFSSPPAGFIPDLPCDISRSSGADDSSTVHLPWQVSRMEMDSMQDKLFSLQSTMPLDHQLSSAEKFDRFKTQWVPNLIKELPVARSAVNR